jgi:magnesium-protoporphyrin IX monomethyl ester (oxidative) cyclase
MRVLLVQPPFTLLRAETKQCHPPLGLAYLAASLRGSHEVAILDSLAEGYHTQTTIDKYRWICGLTFEDIKKRINDFSPDVVGVSCLFSAQYENIEKICLITKEIRTGIITIVGGAHPSAVPQEVLKNKYIDFVVIGDGEATLKELLDLLDSGENFKDIEGIGFKRNGDVMINPQKRFKFQLDDILFPYWDIFPLDLYFKINNPHGGRAKRIPFLPMITSRGCPYECIFCSVHTLWGRHYRARSAENVLSEVLSLVRNFGIREILFEDDNLTFNIERARNIFRGIIDAGIDIYWSLPNGVAVQTLDDELLELMKKSGCYAMSIGVESGDTYILNDVIKKPINLSKIKPVLQKARALGMDTSVFFVVGLPGERRPHLLNTFRCAEYIDADNINFFFATPLPGTRLMELCKQKHLLPEDFRYSHLKSNFPSFSPGEISTAQLVCMVRYERIKLLFLYLFRHPKRFFYKVWKKIRNEPMCFLRISRGILTDRLTNA